MGTIFRRTERRPIPKSATIVEKSGKRFARWHSRGRLRTAPVAAAATGKEFIAVESGTYVAKYRDHAGKVVERSTGCREETTARQNILPEFLGRVRAWKLTRHANDGNRSLAGILFVWSGRSHCSSRHRELREQKGARTQHAPSEAPRSAFTASAPSRARVGHGSGQLL